VDFCPGEDSGSRAQRLGGRVAWRRCQPRHGNAWAMLFVPATPPWRRHPDRLLEHVDRGLAARAG